METKINLKTQTEPVNTDWNRKKQKQKKEPISQTNKKRNDTNRNKKTEKSKTQSTSGQVTNMKADREKEHGKVG